MTTKDKIIDRIILPASYVVAWVSIYFLPRRMFNLGGDNGVEPWILFLVFFFGLPLLLRFILKKNGIAGNKLKGIVYGSVFLAIPFVLFIDSEDNEELKTNGVQTVGIIYKAWLRTQLRRAPTWSVQATYSVDRTTYRTSTKDDADKTLQSGDTVVVVYSSKTPEISEIKELLEYYKE
jgi:hypothetical protein